MIVRVYALALTTIEPEGQNLLIHPYFLKPKPRVASFRFRWFRLDRRLGAI